MWFAIKVHEISEKASLFRKYRAKTTFQSKSTVLAIHFTHFTMRVMHQHDLI